jgi:hypothetical protein
MKPILTLAAILIVSINAHATHLMGGEITWECLGTSAGGNAGKYIFTLKVYEDCRSPVTIGLGSQTIDVWGNASVTSINTTEIPGSPFDLSPPNCGYNCGNAQVLNAKGATHEHILRSLPVTLGNGVPPATGWVFTWWSSARNCSISNIGANPCSHAMLIRSKMFAFNGQPASPCYDSSPAFAERPVSFICSGYSYNYVHTSFDTEFDSLAYAWDTPLDVGAATVWPGIVLPFCCGYSTNNQIPGSPVMNAVTGDVNIFPPAGMQGDFITCIRVDEYRCGFKIAEVYRDIQISLSNACVPVLSGNVNTPPAATSSGSPFTYYADTVFAGDTVHYTFEISDPDSNTNPVSAQEITFTGSGLQFGTNDTSTSGCLFPPCATLDQSSPFSFSGAHIFNFNWITGCNHVTLDDCYQSKSVYQFVLKATDDYCPAPAKNNYIITVVVLGPAITMSGDTLFCSFPNNSGLQWYKDGVLIPGATGTYYIPVTTGVYSVSATTAGACSVSSSPQTVHINCNFTPTVTGNTMLCPNDTAILATQQHDSYQWYKRPIGGSASPVPGATAQTLNIDAFNDAGYYFSVEATDSGCTEISAEVLVDSWVFLLPSVSSTGDFTIGPNGESIVCAGDTMYLNLLQPYTTSITWYNNNVPVNGATSPTLTVTTAGNYTVQGAPQICPNFILPLGVTIEVQVVVCTDIEELSDEMSIYPNPAQQYLYINAGEHSAAISSVAINDVTGKTLMQVKDINSNKINLPLNGLESGIYIVRIRQQNNEESCRKIVVRN